MSVDIGTEVWLRLTCDAGNKCKYHPNSGTMGGWEGRSEADVLQQAQKRGWAILGSKAICPDCKPTEILQEDQ